MFQTTSVFIGMKDTQLINLRDNCLSVWSRLFEFYNISIYVSNIFNFVVSFLR